MGLVSAEWSDTSWLHDLNHKPSRHPQDMRTHVIKFQLLRLHLPLWKRIHNGFQEPSLDFISLTHWTFPFDFPPTDFPLDLPFLLELLGSGRYQEGDGVGGKLLGIFGRTWSSPGRSCRICVISCKESSVVHWRSLINSAITPQIFWSAFWASKMFAVRRFESPCSFWVKKDKNFWVYALRLARWAPWQIAMALSCISIMFLTELRPMLELLISKDGGSSISKLWTARPSNFGTSVALCPWISSDFETDMRYRHGTQRQDLVLIWLWTRLSKRRQGVVSEVRSSLG